MNDYIWIAIISVVAVYCIAAGVRDLRRREYAWGAAALVCAALVLLTPIESHAVKYDLPAHDTR